jgi:hypothetical protein
MGYRIPTIAEWDAEIYSWSSINSAGAFSSTLRLPVSGFRYFVDGSSQDAGYLGHYWSTTVYAQFAKSIYFSTHYLFHDDDSRANANAVRCIRDY